MSTDANAPEILETLQTLIAPGNQVRLSPYVEAMQFQLLFGQAPDPNKRFESARAILNANQQRVRSLAACWSRFEQSGKVFEHERYDAEFLDAYLAYYLTVNVGKLQILFIELLRHHRLPPRFCLLDVGIASGTTFVALLDFLAAWESACRLHDTTFPIESVELIGVDARRDCLDYSQKAIQYLARLIAGSGVSELPLTDWVDTARWVKHDVTEAQLVVPQIPTLLVCSNVLSEGGMGDHGHEHVVDTIRQLPDQSMVLLLEPGDSKRTKALNSWRSKLLDNDISLHLLGPCGSEYSTPVPTQCATCWNARRESLHRPLLYQQFCEEAARVGGRENPKWQQEYENKLLSWSYVSFARSQGDKPHSFHDAAGKDTFFARYIGRYRPKGDNRDIELLIPETDQVTVKPGPLDPREVLEYLKLCPASIKDQHAENIDQVLLRRVAGFTAYSTPTGHPFQRKLDTRSTPTWTVGAKRRAGWMLFTLGWVPPSTLVEAYAGIPRRG